ncbi:rhomboid family intramembrane serine protease [Candidatus Bathyarchaeota archaeon]|nr:MAG: rhomboid family intramembrane serine protease [Candidatus Bathyarchaeota archaeon]
MEIPIGAYPKRRRYKPVATWTLTAVNVAVFIYLVANGLLDEAVMTYGLVPAYILEGRRLYTVLTSMFLHGGFMHLAGNMMYLVVFGSGIEARLGRARFILLYLLSGILASVAHMVILLLFTEPIMVYGPMGATVYDPLETPCVGASGAISGLLGAYLLLFPNANLRVLTFIGMIPVVISIPAVLFIGFWFLYQLYMGYVSLLLPAPFFSGVAFWAHIGGFVAGLIVTPMIGRKARRRRRVLIDRRGRVWYEIPVD